MADLWIKLSVDYPSHPKVIRAGAEASWLAVCAMAYARKHLTNGVIETAVVPTLAAVKRPMVLAAKLVEVGLWEVSGDAFVIHDFLTWNPSRDEVQSKREKWKDTKRTQRSVHDGQGLDKPLDTQKTNASVPRVRADAGAPRAHSASVSDSAPVALEGGAGETKPADVPPVWREPGPRPATNVQSRRAHAGCYFAPAACDRGLCVPLFLGQQWEAQIASGPGDQPAPAYVSAFIKGCLKFTIGPVGDDPLKYWRGQWAVKHGTSVPTTKGARTIAAGNRLQEKLDAGAVPDPFGTNEFHETRRLEEKAGA